MRAEREKRGASAPATALRFGEFSLDPATGELVGPQGREQLDPKVSQVLTLLAQRAGEVVSRDELLAAIWPGSVVTDDAVTRCIYQLRTQLGRAGGSSRYKGLLETLPKRGYRLHSDVEDSGVPPARPARRWPPWAAATALLVLLALAGGIWWLSSRVAPSEAALASEQPSIAVLPFVDLSDAQDQQYFAEGLSEELLNLLAQNDGLRVIARTSSFSFKTDTPDIATIAAKLNVTHVLEGSVRKSGDVVRITAQLVDAASSMHLWSHTYDRKLDDILAVQDDIAASVTEALKVRLDPAEARSLRAGSQPVEGEAYASYLQGRFLYYRRGPGDLQRAREHLEEAVRIEPDFAPAWAALAGVYLLQQVQGDMGEEEARRARTAALERALALDPELPEAHVRLAMHYADLGIGAKAEEYLEKAVALDPDDTLVLGMRGGFAMREGRMVEAIELQRRALLQDPLSAASHANIAVLLMAVGRIEEARVALSKAREISPQFDWRIDEFYLLILERRFEEALRLVESMPLGHDRTHLSVLVMHALGRTAEAQAATRRLHEIPGVEGAVRAAEAAAFTGNTSEALRWLEIAAERLGGRGWYSSEREWLLRARLSPFLADVREDPRWADWIRATSR